MALRNILRDDDPGLSKKSRNVTDFNKRLHLLIDDMRETLIAAKGLGLAAPQVGVLRRVVLIVDRPGDDDAGDDIDVIDDIDDIDAGIEFETDTDADTDAGSASQDNSADNLDDFDDTDDFSDDDISDEDFAEAMQEWIIELINPEIIFEEGEQCGTEGCLSLPGLYGMVTRPQRVIVKAQDRNGVPFELDVTGMTARAACHETDHLDGIIFTSIAERMLTREELDNMNKTT